MTHVITWKRRLYGAQIEHLEHLVKTAEPEAELVINTDSRVSSLAGWVNCPPYIPDLHQAALRTKVLAYLDYLDMQDAKAKEGKAQKLNAGKFQLRSTVTSERVEILITPLATTPWYKRAEPINLARLIAGEIGGTATELNQYTARVTWNAQ